jgi:membrane-associated phospholipid phosphatase
VENITPVIVTAPARAAGIPSAVSHERDRETDPWRVPILEPSPGGQAERLAARLSGWHPALVFLAVIIPGLLLLASVSICLGLLVTQVLLPAWGIEAADERLPDWLAAHRSDARGDASLIGSMISGGVVLPIIGFTLALVFAVLRRWRIGAFTIFALGVESATYGITTLVIHRDRPDVPRLEGLPVDASYPSGHVAASIAVYAGIVLLLTSRFRNRAFQVIAWMIVPAVPIFVALSRMYRGMHHPLDVAGGVAIGICALIVVVFACRTAGAAARAREAR